MDIGVWDVSKYVLLTGAGFSKDYGGFLADEMWSLIFNHPAIQARPALREHMLWELNYEAVYDWVLKNQDLSAGEQRDFTLAIREAYQHLDSIQQHRRTESTQLFQLFVSHFEGTTHPKRIRTFFFTLNQDLLVERHYVGGPSSTGEIMIPGVRRSAEMPAQAPEVRLPTESEMDSIKKSFREKSNGTFAYVKLHGSYSWKAEDGTDRMVIGQTKSAAIQREPLLSWYFQLFQEVLQLPERHLVVIGYSFRDEHINQVLEAAIKTAGLKIHIISPELPTKLRARLINNGAKTSSQLWNSLGGYHVARLRDFYTQQQIELPPRGRALLASLGVPGFVNH